jgi:hypothetical protein
MDYDPVTKTCKPKTPQVTSGDDDPPKPPDVDPNAWMGEYNYTDPKLLSEQITAALTTSKKPSGYLGTLFKMFTPVGGLIDMVSKGSNAAQQAANIQLLEANGKPTGNLKILLEKYIAANRLGPLEDLNLISGDGFYKTLIAEKGENPFGPGTTKPVIEQRTPRVITSEEKAKRKKIAFDLQTANKKRNVSEDKDPFASLTPPQQANVGSASQSTASRQAAAEAVAREKYSRDVGNLQGEDDTPYRLSGSQMISGTEVGATTGGGNYSGPMNKGGLMLKKKRKTKGK